MFGIMIPESFAGVLAAYAGCFQARSYATFQWLALGWVQCLERRTLTAVALASGAVGTRHISVFHRFFARAQWSLDAVGRVVFQQALRWLPAEQPLYLLGDDTLARKQGKCVSLATMHHDPLLSTAKKPFFSFGHVWVVLALWVPLPMGRGRGFALPLLVRLYTGAKRGGRADAPSRPTTRQRQRVAEAAHAARDRRTKLELLAEMVAVVAGWAPERTVYVAVDSAYAGRTLLEHRPANVHVVSRLRLDAALWAPAPKRRPGQKGRPRRRGGRLPSPQQVAALSPLASAGGDHLRAHRHHARAPPTRPLVRRPARAAGADRGRPRSDGQAPGRSVLLHRPGSRRAVHLGSVRPPLVLGGHVP